MKFKVKYKITLPGKNTEEYTAGPYDNFADASSQLQDIKGFEFVHDCSMESFAEESSQK